MLTLRTLTEIAAMPVRKRRYMLDPVVAYPGMSMIYAPAGTGKTLFGMSIAHAIAQGQNFLRWTNDVGPQPVLYVDGEMPEDMLVEYAQKLRPAIDNMRFLAVSMNKEKIPNLSEFEGYKAVEAVLGDAKLIVFDNKSCLFKSGVENEAQSWGVANDWLVGLRARGISSLVIHHANKAGMQRGTNRILDQMDIVMSLRRPPGVPRTIAKFDVTYEKIRAGVREQTREFNVEYQVHNGEATWLARDGTFDPRMADAVRMSKEGMSHTKIAKELGMSKRKLLVLLREAEAFEEGADKRDENPNDEWDKVKDDG